MPLVDTLRHVERYVNKAVAPDVRRGRFSSPLRSALLATEAMVLATILACGTDKGTPSVIIPTTLPEKPVATAPLTPLPEATATFVPGGFGGANPIATYADADPRAKTLNPIIERINDNDPTLTNDERNQVTLAGTADRTATAVAGGTQPKAEGTQTPAPEVKKESVSGILSPEAEATGVYVQWKLPSGRIATGMAFVLKKGDEVRIPKKLQVAGGPSPLYDGYSVTAVGDGQRYALIGDLVSAQEKVKTIDGKEVEQPLLGNVGKNLEAKTVVAIGAGSGKTAFAGTNFNFLIVYPTEEELKAVFQEKAQSPITVNLWDPNARPTTGSTFYGVQPPQKGG